MELSVKPYHKNIYPSGGLLIKGDPGACLRELQGLGISLPETPVYIIPGAKAATIWGFLVMTEPGNKGAQTGKNHYCQVIHQRIFIPVNAILYPAISHEELDKLFSPDIHIFHPDIGWAALPEPLVWKDLLTMPASAASQVFAPQDSAFIPGRIGQFQVKELSPEEVFDNMDKNIFPAKEKWNSHPLNFLEKIKLMLLKGLFAGGGLLNSRSLHTGQQTSSGRGASQGQFSDREPGAFSQWMEKWASKLFGKQSKLMQKWQASLEELEERNKKEVDKLMDLFRKNPEEALKYAIPLDGEGVSRGGHEGLYNMSKRWTDFSLFGNGGSDLFQTSNTVMAGSVFNQLQKQYNETAAQLIKEGEYHKAAFIYMKLLKNNFKAASTLEEGHQYQEAASVYLKLAGSKLKAAECYEKGRMTNQAIELYKELQEDEKVGDLYLTLNKRAEANQYFDKVVDKHASQHRFLKASLICRQKMQEPQRAQSLLMEGWKEDKDAVNCLNNYFANIEDQKLLDREIQRIYLKETNDWNKEKYLQVLKNEYRNHPGVAERVKDIAYEIVAEKAVQNPGIVSELQEFNKKDLNLVADIMKFKHRRR
jgi:tetratricopeptide (TPR) repeat protein